MNLLDYQKSLMDIYQGEILGEALFSRLLETESDAEMRYAYGLLLQLETETKARIRRVLLRYGLPLSEQEKARADGIHWANALRALDASDFLTQFTQEIAPYAQRYGEIAAQAPHEDRECLEFVAAHEHSIYSFLKALKNSPPRKSIDMARVLLHFPLD